MTRRQSYSALSTIFARGPDETLRPFLADFPDFENVLEQGCTDERAVQFESLFGFNVFPVASVYLEADGMLGGAVSQKVAGRMGRAGFPYEELSDPVDHLSTELAFLANLADSSGAEVEIARDFIDQHLLAWIPSFVEAVRRESIPFYTIMAECALDVIYDHRSMLGAASAPDSDAVFPRSIRLDDETTGLHEIAVFLTTPARCGFFLSRSVIAKIARGSRLPHGFGGRQQMMVTSVRSAAAYDELESLIDRIKTIVAKDKSVWEANALHGPAAAFWAESWMKRLDATHEILETMGDFARRLAP